MTKREIYVQNIIRQTVRFTLVPRVSEYISSVHFWTYQAKEKIFKLCLISLMCLPDTKEY